MNDAARLRALADGEITADQAGDVASQTDRVEHERALKESVSRVMGDESVRAPEALRRSVIQMFREEAPASDSRDEQPAVVTTPMGDTTDRSFWGGVGRYVAIAAVLGLVVTVLIVGAAKSFTNPVVRSPFTRVQVADVQDFLPRAHEFTTECSREEFEQKFVSKTIGDAVELTQEHLAGVPDDLAQKMQRLVDNGFEFVGMGACHVPGNGNSVHAYFRPKGGGEAVSVFVQTADATLLSGMCGEHCFGLDCEKDPSTKENLIVWKCSGYLHYIYSPDAEIAARARTAFNAPPKMAPLMPAVASAR